MPRDSSLIQLGPGTLRSAPLGTAEPPDIATAYAAAWIDLGYTEEGSAFSYALTSENVPVAEEFDPVKVVTTGRTASVAFALAQVTAENLKRSLNGGTITTAVGIVTFEPPAPGAEVRRMLAWDSEDGQERWIFRQCFQTGNVEIARRKAPAKATIPTVFTLEKPTGLQPFKAIFVTARAGT